MRVLAACSLGGAGHLNPLRPFLDAARDRGHDVLVTGPPALTDMVERAGHAFHAGGEPPESEIAPIRERLPVAPPLEASILGNRDLFGRLAATAMLPTLRELGADWRPDLILRDPCEYASAVVAAELGIRVAQVAISLGTAEAGSIAAATPALEAHRVGLTALVRETPYLTRFPASLDPSPFVDTVRYREPVPPPSGPLPDWWDVSETPLVYVTFGTVLGFMSLAASVFRTALDAVADLDVRVLLTVGRKFDAADLGPLPPNVHLEPWVDQADVLVAADLVVCHGGSGTMLGSLAAGVPMVVAPMFADQFVNAEQVAACGAGLVVRSHAESDESRQVLTPEDGPEITRAVETVLAVESYRRRAQAVAGEMRAARSAGDVLDALLARE